jgi:hypothetical protein
MNSSEVKAAIITALAAIGASLLVAVISVLSSRRNDARSAHRTILGPFLEDLGLNIAGVVATADVFVRRVESGQDLSSWRKKMEVHGEALKAIRSRVRYPLFGIDKALLALSRTASWIPNFKNDPENGRKLLESARTLGTRLDKVIAKSYRRGEPPTLWDRFRVKRSVASLEADWSSFKEPRSLNLLDAGMD